MSDPKVFRDRAHAVAHMLKCDPLIRTVNFHNTSRAQSERFDKQLAHYSKHFSAVDESDLDRYLTTGKWHKQKPGLIIAVYEGYRNGYDVLAPLIEQHGFIGWYFLITGFLNAQTKDQRSFARRHYIDMKTHEYADGRYALSWDEVRTLERKHVIASHARTHSELAKLDPEVVQSEVVGSQQDFEKQLGRKVKAFASLTGPPFGQNPISDSLVRTAQYRFVFSNFRIQRIHA